MKVNSIDFTVVGVASRGFTGTMALVGPRLWMPLGLFDIVVNDMFKNTGDGLSDRKAGTVIAFGRLKEGVSLAIASVLDVLAKRLGEDPFNKDMALTVNPLPRA